MRYYVSLDPPGASPPADPVLVDVTELPTGQIEIAIGGKPVDVDVVWLDGLEGTASVRVDGKVVDLTVEGQPPDLGAIAGGHRSYVRVESERQRAAAAARKGGGGGGEKVIKAPMPGRIVRVLAAPGADVEAGATLCVMEAMKMENEVKAKAACRVVEVHVAEGATVDGGAKLFTLG
jgi:biotin carboxyl carrier protein